MKKDFNTYVEEVTEDINRTIEDKGCQPILFVGSGFSKRYFDGPNWDQLLEKMAEFCPLIDKDFAYYKQSLENNIAIGTKFADDYQKWAWGEGKTLFDDELFSADKSSDIYLKRKVCEYFDGICPSSIDEIEDEVLKSELNLFKLIKPHSIITTNYDGFLEVLFPDYVPVIGQKILKSDHLSIGEIFKIHGCTSEFEDIVLTEKDYDTFSKKKKYLSAKMLTYFIEHPLVFVGYSAQDRNIISILSDIDEALSNEGELVKNIYMLNWKKDVSSEDYPTSERILPILENKSIRIKSITADAFGWVFDAFATDSELDSVNIKSLRSIMARTYELVRHDIPRKAVEVDFDMLNRAIASEDSVAKLFGITTLNNSSSVNAEHKYIPSELAEKTGFSHWTGVNAAIENIKESTGKDIRASDNKYHIRVSSGKVNFIRKYSDLAVGLINDHKNGDPYTVDLTSAA